ncbi:hypothetical protein C8A03DRAFT_34993 [Achaetomium macrosporum]|uniref:Uncharacterized protein n=1 Tax=Achaetomium macrosporum TaxID=79813 RepID=A0AAN7HEC4_9PEZI|nr:hypothetical protein C8A03DRAFT_34993 [Achaetomium macrosporum]
MKHTTAILLILVTLTTAAPNININAAADAAMLSPRQEDCVYGCACNSDSTGPDPDTPTCCSAVGGDLGNGGTLCNEMNLATAQAYAACCGRTPGYTCFKSARTCPDVILN